jgi:hypothetical protein
MVLRLSVLPARSITVGSEVTTVEKYFVPLRRLLIWEHSNPVFVIGLDISIDGVVIVIIFFVLSFPVSDTYFEMVSCFLV